MVSPSNNGVNNPLQQQRSKFFLAIMTMTFGGRQGGGGAMAFTTPPPSSRCEAVWGTTTTSSVQRCRTSFDAGGGRTQLFSTTVADTDAPTSSSSSRPAVGGGFIDTELRGAAMRLHTRSQAPREGRATEPKKATKSDAPPYIPTLDDYLAFLVDSKHVYEALEEAVTALTEEYPQLAVFQNTGLERTIPLEHDIQYLMKEYDLIRPDVGQAGQKYADEIRRILAGGENKSKEEEEGSATTTTAVVVVPEFICHYYNFYFAHTAGGRMIGKKMASLLLDKRTLEFYKWDGDLNEIKGRVKNSIEELAATWTEDEKQVCVDATGPAFMLGGSLNGYLMKSGGHH